MDDPMITSAVAAIAALLAVTLWARGHRITRPDGHWKTDTHNLPKALQDHPFYVGSLGRWVQVTHPDRFKETLQRADGRTMRLHREGFIARRALIPNNIDGPINITVDTEARTGRIIRQSNYANNPQLLTNRLLDEWAADQITDDPERYANAWNPNQ